MKKAKEWIEKQDFLWLSVTETERLIKAYEAGQIELIEKVKELQEQIEKMKNCYNCANDTLEPPEVIGNGICEHCKNCDKWELEY